MKKTIFLQAPSSSTPSMALSIDSIVCCLESGPSLLGSPQHQYPQTDVKQKNQNVRNFSKKTSLSNFFRKKNLKRLKITEQGTDSIIVGLKGSEKRFHRQIQTQKVKSTPDFSSRGNKGPISLKTHRRHKSHYETSNSKQIVMKLKRQQLVSNQKSQTIPQHSEDGSRNIRVSEEIVKWPVENAQKIVDLTERTRYNSDIQKSTSPLSYNFLHPQSADFQLSEVNFMNLEKIFEEKLNEEIYRSKNSKSYCSSVPNPESARSKQKIKEDKQQCSEDNLNQQSRQVVSEMGQIQADQHLFCLNQTQKKERIPRQELQQMRMSLDTMNIKSFVSLKGSSCQTIRQSEQSIVVGRMENIVSKGCQKIEGREKRGYLESLALSDIKLNNSASRNKISMKMKKSDVVPLYH